MLGKVEKELVTFEEFFKKLPKKPPRKWTARYYGTRQLEIFPELFLKYVNKYSGFIDITAGGGRFLYDQALKGKVIGANDRCYYSYCALSSVFLPKNFEPNWFRKIWDVCAPTSVTPLNGYSSEHCHTVNKELRGYIDALCTIFSENPFVQYGIGKGVRQLFTFRGLGWCGTSPIKIKSIDITPVLFFYVFMKVLWMTYLYYQQLQNTEKNEVLWQDALHSVKAFSTDLIRSSVVYIDPAWPWCEKYGNQSNPYRFYTKDLSSILLQKKQEVDFWKQNTELILNEIGSWIETSFVRGAPCVVLCGQSSNFPSPEVIKNNMRHRFKMTEWIEVQDQSKSQYHFYKTFWGIFEP